MNRYILFFILISMQANVTLPAESKIISTLLADFEELKKKIPALEVNDRVTKLKELLMHKTDPWRDKNSVMTEFDKTFYKLILSPRLTEKQCRNVLEHKSKCHANMIEAFDREGTEYLSNEDAKTIIYKQLESCIATVVGNDMFEERYR